MCTIEVAPAPGGWQVTLPLVANAMFYRSGRAAETAAKTLAARLVRRGLTSQVRIYLRDGSLAAEAPAVGEPLAQAA
jgi:hypothetical protein